MNRNKVPKIESQNKNDIFRESLGKETLNQVAHVCTEYKTKAKRVHKTELQLFLLGRNAKQLNYAKPSVRNNRNFLVVRDKKSRFYSEACEILC